MTQFLFIRHGQADYSKVNERGFIGHGLDLAPLTALGQSQLKETAQDPRLSACDIIISSPYTRALESAAIINRRLNLALHVEVGLHEWIPDIVNFRHQTSQECFALSKDFYKYDGVHPEGESKVWETKAQMEARLLPILDKYKHYEKVIVVCHGMLMRNLTGQVNIENGEIIAINLP